MVFLLKHGHFSNCQKSIDWLESGLVLIEWFANYYYILFPGKNPVNEISPWCFLYVPQICHEWAKYVTFLGWPNEKNYLHYGFLAYIFLSLQHYLHCGFGDTRSNLMDKSGTPVLSTTKMSLSSILMHTSNKDPQEKVSTEIGVCHVRESWSNCWC